MRLSLLCLFLAMQAHAQSFKKNEVVIGYGAGYFFDETGFKLTDYDGLLYSSTAAYTRRISKRFSLRLLYSHHQFDYHSDWRFGKPETTYYRYAWRWGISAGYSIATGIVPIRVTAGLARCSGAKLIFYGYYPGARKEPILDGPGYTKLGGSLGISIGHPIIWRFFGELEGQYLRVNTDIDPSQFYLSYRIGFKF